MTSSPAAALTGALPCLCLVLGKAALLQAFLTPAHSSIPAPGNALWLHHHHLSSSQQRPHRQRTRLQCSEHDADSGRSRSSRRWSPARVGATKLWMANLSPGGGESGGGVGRATARGWIATLLCVASFVGGPDLLLGKPHGLPTSLRPPLASALSEEQVSELQQ